VRTQWDETTYRVTSIPDTFNKTDFSKVVKDLFELAGDDLKVHSFAYDATRETEARSKVATISFRSRPALLQSSENDSNEWCFSIASSSTDPNQYSRIYIDKHFNLFTPLSPAEREKAFTIEFYLYSTHENRLTNLVAFLYMVGEAMLWAHLNPLQAPTFGQEIPYQGIVLNYDYGLMATTQI
jgi:hypothetical protein